MAPTPHERFATLVEPHLPELRAFVDRRAPDLTDDVLSEVGIVAWRRLDDVPAGRERAWLFGVTRNLLLAERRKLARRDTGRADIEVTDVPDSALDPALATTVHRPLAVALGRLAERDRELLLLTAWEGLSTAEAAAVLEIRATTARMALVRARRRLAAVLDTLDPDWSQTRPASDSGARTAARQTTSPRSAEEVEPCTAAKR